MVAPRVNRFIASTHYAEYKAGQTASTVFQVFVMTRPGIEPSLPALMGSKNVRAQSHNATVA